MSSALTDDSIRVRLATGESMPASVGPRRVALDVLAFARGVGSVKAGVLFAAAAGTLSAASVGCARLGAVAARTAVECATYDSEALTAERAVAAVASEITALHGALADARVAAARKRLYEGAARELAAGTDRATLSAALEKVARDTAEAAAEAAALDVRLMARCSAAAAITSAIAAARVALDEEAAMAAAAAAAVRAAALADATVAAEVRAAALGLALGAAADDEGRGGGADRGADRGAGVDHGADSNDAAHAVEADGTALETAAASAVVVNVDAEGSEGAEAKAAEADVAVLLVGQFESNSDAHVPGGAEGDAGEAGAMDIIQSIEGEEGGGGGGGVTILTLRKLTKHKQSCLLALPVPPLCDDSHSI